MTKTHEILSTVPTHFEGPAAEISIVATALQADSHGALSRREAIEQARARVLARSTPEHHLLAAAWVRYHSLSGRASENQIAKVMRQLDVESLRRMTSARRIHVEAA